MSRCRCWATVGERWPPSPSVIAPSSAGTRRCSRRHRLLCWDPSTRESIQHLAQQACAAIRYASAGTIEFLVDAQQRFYFMEMNTRIQVEHPVTEAVSGADIVREQITGGGRRADGAQRGAADRRPCHRVPHQRRGLPRTTSFLAPARLRASFCPADPG